MFSYITSNIYVTYSFCAITTVIWLLAVFHLFRKNDFSAIGKFWLVIVLFVPLGSMAYFAWVKHKKPIDLPETAGIE